MKVRYLACGSCVHPEAVVLPGGNPLRMRVFPSSVAVLEHPTRGIALFDTGYSARFLEITRRFPERFYALVTPVSLDPEASAVRQLARLGVPAKDVRAVILSHFHADHVGGAADFPKAEYVYSRIAYDRVREKSRLGQVRSGFLKALLPADFESRGRPVESIEERIALGNLGAFREGIDVFGDGSAIAVPLAGHTPGHFGLLVRRDDGTSDFLVADACWTARSFIENRMPSPIARIAIADPAAYRETLGGLHRLHRERADVRIIPCHCRETLEPILTRG